MKQHGVTIGGVRYRVDDDGKFVEVEDDEKEGE